MLSIFRERNFKIENFPNSYDNYSRVITLPVYPQLSDEDVKLIIDSVSDSYNAVVKS